MHHLQRISRAFLFRIFSFEMDGGGFEPPKQFAADLQSVPFGHSGIRPYEMYNLNNISLYHTAGQIASSFLEIG